MAAVRTPRAADVDLRGLARRFNAFMQLRDVSRAQTTLLRLEVCPEHLGFAALARQYFEPAGLHAGVFSFHPTSNTTVLRHSNDELEAMIEGLRRMGISHRVHRQQRSYIFSQQGKRFQAVKELSRTEMGELDRLGANLVVCPGSTLDIFINATRLFKGKGQIDTLARPSMQRSIYSGQKSQQRLYILMQELEQEELAKLGHVLSAWPAGARQNEMMMSEEIRHRNSAAERLYARHVLSTENLRRLDLHMNVHARVLQNLIWSVMKTHIQAEPMNRYALLQRGPWVLHTVLAENVLRLMMEWCERRKVAFQEHVAQLFVNALRRPKSERINLLHFDRIVLPLDDEGDAERHNLRSAGRSSVVVRLRNVPLLMTSHEITQLLRQHGITPDQMRFKGYRPDAKARVVLVQIPVADVNKVFKVRHGTMRISFTSSERLYPGHYEKKLPRLSSASSPQGDMSKRDEAMYGGRANVVFVDKRTESARPSRAPPTLEEISNDGARWLICDLWLRRYRQLTPLTVPVTKWRAHAILVEAATGVAAVERQDEGDVYTRASQMADDDDDESDPRRNGDNELDDDDGDGDDDDDDEDEDDGDEEDDDQDADAEQDADGANGARDRTFSPPPQPYSTQDLYIVPVTMLPTSVMPWELVSLVRHVPRPVHQQIPIVIRLTEAGVTRLTACEKDRTLRRELTKTDCVFVAAPTLAPLEPATPVFRGGKVTAAQLVAERSAGATVRPVGVEQSGMPIEYCLTRWGYDPFMPPLTPPLGTPLAL